MRPWMKMFAFGGIVGVSLSLCVAADQPTDRRIGGATKKPSKLGQLQFFGRHNSAASDKKDTPQEQPAVTTDSPSDASAGLPINTEIESLKADVSMSVGSNSAIVVRVIHDKSLSNTNANRPMPIK